MKTFNSLKEAQAAIRSGEINLPDLVEYYIERIESRPSVNAFLEVFSKEARAQALSIQNKIESGKAGKLAGMVIGVKDNICIKGHKVSASSKILEGFESLYTATAVERILNEDVIVIGRLNCDEFAMGSSNENSAYGVVRNPIDESTVPGGSSGGSAAAVAGATADAGLTGWL